MLARIIGMKLTEEQYEVVHAYDGEQAYQLMTQEPVPDLVLLDVLIPKMSGFDVLEKVVKEGKAKSKVIVFSNFAQQADIEKAHELGAVDYIVKAAFSPAEILTRVREVLSGAPSSTATPGTVSTPAKQPVAPAAPTSPIPAMPGAPVTPPAKPGLSAPANPQAPMVPTPPAAPGGDATPYQSFKSMEEVMPMSEVLHPGEPNNNP